jgi:Fe-S-cluster containining protein
MSLCDECNGACCRVVTIRVGEVTADQAAWAAMRGRMSGGTWEVRATCENLTVEGRCAIYDRRPEVCREYESGGKQCRSARSQQGLK